MVGSRMPQIFPASYSRTVVKSLKTKRSQKVRAKQFHKMPEKPQPAAWSVNAGHSRHIAHYNSHVRNANTTQHNTISTPAVKSSHSGQLSLLPSVEWEMSSSLWQCGEGLV